MREFREIDDSDEDEAKERLLTLEERKKILEEYYAEISKNSEQKEIKEVTAEETNDFPWERIDFSKRLMTPKERDAILKAAKVLDEDEEKENLRSETKRNEFPEVREYFETPHPAYRELLDLITGNKDNNLDEGSETIEVGTWSSIGPVFLNEQMRRLHGIIERGYDSDDAGDSSRGWANQELVTTIYEILGASIKNETKQVLLSERMKKLKQSTSSSDVFAKNRVYIHLDALEESEQNRENILLSPWWLETENRSNPISLPRLLAYGRFANHSETLYEIGTGTPVSSVIVKDIDSYFGDTKYLTQVALRCEMVSAEETARLAGKEEVKKIAVFMMDGSEQPVVLGYDGNHLAKLDNKESTLPSHRLTPIDVKVWGDSTKSTSTKYMSTIKVALYERTTNDQWSIKKGNVKPGAIEKLLTLTDENAIRNCDDTILSKCLLRLKVGSNSRVNPKRTKFLYDSIDCATLANVLFGNDIHLIEVKRKQSEGPIRALTELEMTGPTRLSSTETVQLLFEFEEVKSKTVDTSTQVEANANPWGYIASLISGKVQHLLHRSVVEGKPIINFEGIENIAKRMKLANRQHIVQETDLLVDEGGPDKIQSESIFAYVSLATKRLFQNIQNGETLAEILWKTTGYLRSVNFGAPVRTGHTCLSELPANQNISLRRRIANTQTQIGGSDYHEASLAEVIDSIGNPVLQMTELGQKAGFLFLSLDSSKYDSIPSGWNLNNEILGIQFWLKDNEKLKDWMMDSTEFAKLERKIGNLSRISQECYNIDLTQPFNVERKKQEASTILSSIVSQIDSFATKNGLSPSDAIDLERFVDTICETVLLTKNTITTEPERASLSLPYHLDRNGMPIKVPNSLCPVSAEHLTAFFASLGAYSRYSELLNKIERNSTSDERHSIAVDARPANGGSDVVILSIGTEGDERMYETENKTYRYTDYQDRHATRKRLLTRILESKGWETKYHTINFVDAQRGFEKEQISYMLEPTSSRMNGLERDEHLLSEFMKSSLRVSYALQSRMKQVAEVTKDTYALSVISPRMEKMRAFYSDQFGEELGWKGEKKPREKSIDWSSISGVSNDQSLLRLSGKQLFKGENFEKVQRNLGSRTFKFLNLLGWVEKKKLEDNLGD